MESEPKWTNKTKQTPAFRAIETDGGGKETTIIEHLEHRGPVGLHLLFLSYSSQ